MKTFIISAFLLISSSAFAGNYEARQELLQARALIDSALKKMDQERNIVATRLVKNAQYICRESATTNEVLEAIASAKKEVSARCDGRCEVVVQLQPVGYDCSITAKGF